MGSTTRCRVRTARFHVNLSQATETKDGCHGHRIHPTCSPCCAISPIPVGRKASFTGLPHVFLFSILAIMAGANSYRAIHSFIDVHLHRLKQTFGLNWRRAPAYTTVRGKGVAAGDVEAVFRLHAQILNESAACQGMRVVAFDGKTLRGSFDKFTDTRPAHLVSAFAADSALVLGHLEIDQVQRVPGRPAPAR